MQLFLPALVVIALLHAAHADAQRFVPLARYCAQSARTQPKLSPLDEKSWSRPARVAGQVVNYAGAPVTYADVRLLRKITDTIPLRAARVDGRGVFQLDSIPPNDYVLSVRRLGYQTQWHALQLRGNFSDTLCLRMRFMTVELAPVVAARKPR